MNKIHRDDEVVVIAGKDKGKRGKVISVFGNSRVIVDGVNIVKRHVKPNPQRNITGGIVDKEVAIQISNIAIWNQETGKADRVGFIFDENGNKKRIFKSNRSLIDV